MSNTSRMSAVAVFALFVAGLTLHATRPVVGGRPEAPPAPYLYTDLSGLTAGDFVQSEALAISNSDGDGNSAVAGHSYAVPASAKEIHPTLWNVTDTGGVVSREDLGLPPGLFDALAVDVNDAGVVVGRDDWYGDRGFVSIPGFGFQPLPTFGGATSSPHAVNNWGDIVGDATDFNGDVHGALWHIDGQGVVTGPLDLADFIPHDINDLGVMAGERRNVPSIASIDAQLGLQVMPLPGATLGAALAINNRNDVVGRGDSSNEPPFYCPAGGTTTSLPTLGFGGEALDINDQRQIVGWAWKPFRQKSGTSYRHAAVVWENGAVSDLNVLAGMPSSSILLSAEGINDLGQIVGGVRINYTKSTELHGFLLTKRP